MNFTLAEFTREVMVPVSVADKILRYHIPTLERVRAACGHEPVLISEQSGYRSVRHEQSKGRSGRSEHCFQHQGAVDVTAADLAALGAALRDVSAYTRLCFYPGQRFYHCDFRPSSQRLYTCSDGQHWARKPF